MVFLSQLSSSSSHRMSPLKSSPLLEVFSLLLPWSQLRPSISRASGLLWDLIYEATRHHKRHFFQCITSGFLCSISCRSSSSGLPPNSLGKSLLLASLRTWSYESVLRAIWPRCPCYHYAFHSSCGGCQQLQEYQTQTVYIHLEDNVGEMLTWILATLWL